jgi:lysophospholipase L1-like esterase
MTTPRHISVLAALFACVLLAPGARAELPLPFWGGPATGGCEDIAPGRLAPVPAVATHSGAAKRHFRKRLQEFSGAPLACGQIVMLGDSLTELNDWEEAIPGNAGLRNRGISGDTSDGVLARLDEIIASQPRAVFLLIGTNDLWTDNSAAITVSNIARTADRIRAKSPETMVIVQTVFPVRKVAWERNPDTANEKVRAINALLKRQSRAGRFLLLDTYALLVDRGGKLNAAYTSDGLHLNEAGNAAWSLLVTHALRKHGLLGANP